MEGYESYEFPLNGSEIEGMLEKLPSKDIEGLKEIIVTPPLKNADFQYYGRYVSGGTIYLFAHQKKGDKFVIELNHGESVKFITEEFKNKAYRVLVHEIGHHIGIRDLGDSSEDFANDYQLENITKYFPHLLK